jgi:hypothetical protein
MAAMPLTDVVDDGLFDSNPYDHDAYRETMHCTHSHLQSWEYYQVLRGRVLFNKTESRFYCYLDKLVCIPAIQRMIIARFHLPRKHTTFQTDLHYTIDPDELDQLSSHCMMRSTLSFCATAVT